MQAFPRCLEMAPCRIAAGAIGVCYSGGVGVPNHQVLPTLLGVFVGGSRPTGQIRTDQSAESVKAGAATAGQP